MNINHIYITLNTTNKGSSSLIPVNHCRSIVRTWCIYIKGHNCIWIKTKSNLLVLTFTVSHEIKRYTCWVWSIKKLHSSFLSKFDLSCLFSTPLYTQNIKIKINVFSQNGFVNKILLIFFLFISNLLISRIIWIKIFQYVQDMKTLMKYNSLQLLVENWISWFQVFFSHFIVIFWKFHWYPSVFIQTRSCSLFVKKISKSNKMLMCRRKRNNFNILFQYFTYICFKLLSENIVHMLKSIAISTILEIPFAKLSYYHLFVIGMEWILSFVGFKARNL